MTVPSRHVELSKGYHEYEMELNRSAVKSALDIFYSKVNRYRTKYRILGTRVDGRGWRATFILKCEILQESSSSLTPRTVRRPGANTATQNMRRMRAANATPEELAEAAESRRQRELDQRIERMDIEIAAGRAEVDQAYMP